MSNCRNCLSAGNSTSSTKRRSARLRNSAQKAETVDIQHDVFVVSSAPRKRPTTRSTKSLMKACKSVQADESVHDNGGQKEKDHSVNGSNNINKVEGVSSQTTVMRRSARLGKGEAPDHSSVVKASESDRKDLTGEENFTDLSQEKGNELDQAESNSSETSQEPSESIWQNKVQKKNGNRNMKHSMEGLTFICETCGKKLASTTAMKYHKQNNVCEKFLKKQKNQKRKETLHELTQKRERSKQARIHIFVENEERKQREKEEYSRRLADSERKEKEEYSRILADVKRKNAAPLLTEKPGVIEAKHKKTDSDIWLGSYACNEAEKSTMSEPGKNLFLRWVVPDDMSCCILHKRASALIGDAKEVFLWTRKEESLEPSYFLESSPEAYGLGAGEGLCLQPLHAGKTVLAMSHIEKSGVRNPDFLLHVAKRVTALSFCPSTDKSAYLAVGTLESNDAIHVVGCNTNSVERKETALQLWMVNDDSCALGYLLQICSGAAVVSLSWCPEETNLAVHSDGRGIGLLAASFRDGFVRIYAMPKPKRHDEVPEPKIYDDERLTVFNTSVISSITCLCWHSARPYETLIAGLCTGGILVWNVNRICCEYDPTYSAGGSITAKTYPSLCLNSSSFALAFNGMGPAFMYAKRGIVDVCCCKDAPNSIASISNDSFVRIWDMRFPERPILQMIIFTSFRLTSVDWPVKCDYLLIGDESGTVRTVELASGANTSFRFHRGAVNQIVSNPRYSPPLFLSCATDGSVLCWRGPRFLSHTEKDGQILAIPSKIANLGRKSKISVGIFKLFNFSPLSLFQLPLPHGETASEKTPDPVLLFSSNDPVVPLDGNIPRFDTRYKSSESNPPPREISVTSVAWGVDFRQPSVESRFEWCALGGNASVVRLTRLHVPMS